MSFSFKGKSVFTTGTLGRQKSSQHISTTALSKLRGDIQRLLDASLTNSSLASYSHAWTVFKDFAEKYELIIEFPVKQHILVYYVAYLFSKDYAATTISSYLSAISYIHKLNSFGDPCSSFLIQKLLLSTRKLKPSQDVRIPITKNILHQICDFLPVTVSNAFEKALFKAMFLLAFYGFLRVGEITSCQKVINKNLILFNQISRQQDHLIIKFVTYKHHMGKPFFLTIHSASNKKYCPVQCLEDYIKLRGVQNGPLFCYVPNIPVSRGKLSAVLKNCLSFAKLDMSRITSHSFRIGMASHCADIGMSDSKIRLLGRWKSDAFKSYIRPVNLV